MSVRKISISLDEKLYEAASTRARAAGLSLSTWLARIVDDKLALEAGLRAVAEWEAEHGAFTAEEIAAADRLLGSFETR